MRAVVTIVAAVALGLWSLAAYALHALVGVAGNAAALNADLLPVPPEWVVFISQLLSDAGGIGGVLVVVVWAIGAFLIGGVAALGLAFTRRGPRRDLPPPDAPRFVRTDERPLPDRR